MDKLKFSRRKLLKTSALAACATALAPAVLGLGGDAAWAAEAADRKSVV